MAQKDWKIDRKGISWIEKKSSRSGGYDSRGNRYGRVAIYVFKSPDGWVVRDTTTFQNPEISPNFKTKREAVIWAKEYMKDHPEGQI